MGHNASWISRNASEPRNTSGAEAASANRSALGEFGEAQLYRQFTTTVQIVIFIGSLLGKPPAGPPPAGLPRGRRLWELRSAVTRAAWVASAWSSAIVEGGLRIL
ncbi:Hypothetical predicted protein [Marmota monax]|uniref:Uncharacterized protein n=1 Tax=Marmota monax TaxID=9995 RepID=A0A5E4B0T8_MARMO|nr:hypothetical protein GHT09_008118 [Marmota monax]VTJ62730.1 Hypothetical predicted protein [Marmota monax]